MYRIALPALLLLTACGTPQEQCISRATRDMRVVDRLIAESEATLARGYAYEEKTIYRTRWVNCGPRPTKAEPRPAPQMCLDDVAETIRQPVAVDLRVEAQKLAGLKGKRAAQAKAATPAIRSCKAEHPE